MHKHWESYLWIKNSKNKKKDYKSPYKKIKNDESKSVGMIYFIVIM